MTVVPKRTVQIVGILSYPGTASRGLDTNNSLITDVVVATEKRAVARLSLRRNRLEGDTARFAGLAMRPRHDLDILLEHREHFHQAFG
jgi:hypothetical protein